jgi:hypothetical protein
MKNEEVRIKRKEFIKKSTSRRVLDKRPRPWSLLQPLQGLGLRAKRA